jgi:hypothetical protein
MKFSPYSNRSTLHLFIWFSKLNYIF